MISTTTSAMPTISHRSGTRTSAPLMPAAGDGALPDDKSAELQSLLDEWVGADK